MTNPPPALAAALAERYAIEREIGRGGMATVYLAEDRKHGRKVAVKVLDASLTATLGAERFLREIRIAARLAHPHILPLIDSGEAGGWLYYVSPHVPDGSLRDRLRREPRLSVGESLRIAQEVGAALDYAHRQGFVHRDVKPENILFADRHAVLADFGIARAYSTAGAASVTEVGMALGTPEYMSPEQAAGEQDLGTPSDVYSLACVVYEMLAGRPPIRGDGARATMAKQVTEPPAPLRASRPDAPVHIERALARALAKDPAERLRTAAEFVAALQAPAGAVGVSVAAWGRGIAVLPFANASGDPDNEYLSDGITDELISALAKVEGLRVASRTSVFALKGKPQDVRAIGALLGASGGKPAAHHRAAHLDGRRAAALVRALRPYPRGRVRDPGGAGQDHRRYAAGDVVRGSDGAAGAALHAERRRLWAVFERPVRLEQAVAGGSRRGDRLFPAGDRGRSRLRPGVRGARGFLRVAAGLSQRAGRRRIRARQGVRPQGARA